MVFFDIDDTLLDYRSSQDSAAAAFARLYPKYIEDPDDFPRVWNEVTERNMARYLSGDLTFQEQRQHRIRESFRIDFSPKDADTIFNVYYQMYEDSWSLFPEVWGVLNRFSELPIGVITNGDKTHQSYKLEKLGILHLFKEVITPACAGAAKPNLEIFRFAASRSGKAARECWYIGDSFETDYQGAREAGFRSVWLNRSGRNINCENQCKDLNEFWCAIRRT